MTPEEMRLCEDVGEQLTKQFERLPVKGAVEFFAAWYFGMLRKHGATRVEVQDWANRAIAKIFSMPQGRS